MIKPYYEESGITIYHGDCRDVLPRLPWCDLVLTDPPYPNNAGHFINAVEVARDVLSALTPERFIVFWHQLETPPCVLPLVARHGWLRTNTNRPDNYEAIYEHANEGERPSRIFSHAVIHPALTGCTEATGHPTQKPVKLMRQLIALRSGVQVVLDPFMGSGTTLRAAKDLGRKAIGIEISEEYCRIAVERLRQETLDFSGTSEGVGANRVFADTDRKPSLFR